MICLKEDFVQHSILLRLLPTLKGTENRFCFFLFCQNWSLIILFNVIYKKSQKAAELLRKYFQMKLKNQGVIISYM